MAHKMDKFKKETKIFIIPVDIYIFKNNKNWIKIVFLCEYKRIKKPPPLLIFFVVSRGRKQKWKEFKTFNLGYRNITFSYFSFIITTNVHQEKNR